MRVRELLARYPKPAVCIDSQRPLDEAVLLMRQQTVDSLVVTQAGRPVGILSEREALLHGMPGSGGKSQGRPVKEVMLTHFWVASPQDDIGPLAASVQSGDIRHIPVIDEPHGVVGVISALDLLRCHAQQLSAELKFLQEYIQDLRDAGLD
jgi:CBS domain-containing protein